MFSVQAEVVVGDQLLWAMCPQMYFALVPSRGDVLTVWPERSGGQVRPCDLLVEHLRHSSRGPVLIVCSGELSADDLAVLEQSGFEIEVPGAEQALRQLLSGD